MSSASQPLSIGKAVEHGVRRTGIRAIGDVTGGTHFFLFYETKEDLLDALVPYFKAGLESGEFCLPQWSGQKRPCVVTSKPAIWNGPGRSPYLSCFLLIRQVCFGSPASRSAF